MKKRLRAPSPAIIISLVALFVALGGTTYAATRLPSNSVGTKQLKKNAVTASKIKDGAVSASKINPAGLTVPNASQAANSSLLDGFAANHFLPATGTAANSTLLDGIDSSGFVQGNGNMYTQAVAIPQHNDGTYNSVTLPVAPGLASLSIDCPPDNEGPVPVHIAIANLSGGTLNAFWRNDVSGSTQYQLVDAAWGFFASPNGAGDITTLTIQGIPTSTGLQTVMTADLATLIRSGTNDCHAHIQALTTHP